MSEILSEQSTGVFGIDNDTLGGRICSARETLGLSTAQLARRLGVKTTTMAGWELDRSEPRSNKLVMLAGILNVSPSWLLTGVGESPSDEISTNEIATLQGNLVQLRTQAISIAEQIDRLVERLDSHEHFRGT
ncbi:MAG: helix-turn-helix domain-containing protein [Hyphomicrobiaceae bacterium]